MSEPAVKPRVFGVTEYLFGFVAAAFLTAATTGLAYYLLYGYVRFIWTSIAHFLMVLLHLAR